LTGFAAVVLFRFGHQFGAINDPLPKTRVQSELSVKTWSKRKITKVDDVQANYNTYTYQLYVVVYFY
jgi:hypothetical protein